MTNEEAVKIIKNQFTSIGKGVLMNALCSWAPIFKVPPFSTIANLILEKELAILATNAETGAFFAYTNFNVDSQGRDFMAAALTNHNIQMIGTPEEKKIAEENVKNAFRKLIRFTN